MESDPMLEDLMSQLGRFGRYQLRQHLLHVLAAFLAGVHTLSLTAVAPTPPHRCYIDEIDSNATSFTFDDSILEKYIPFRSDGTLESCSKFNGNTTDTLACDEFVFDTTYHKTSSVIDWGLVCDKRWERAALQSIYMFGALMGVIILGSLADKYGRKTIFYISGICQLIFGVTAAFIPHYFTLTATLFFYGMFGSAGAYLGGFVLTMEMVSPDKRTLCGIMFSLVFSIGIMADALWASIIHDYRLLQCVLALHALLLVGHWWLIDESVRWLWSQGRFEEAVKIIKRGVKINRGTFVSPLEGKLPEAATATPANANKEESLGVLEIFKSSTLRIRMMIVTFIWFANSLVYYGLSLNTGELLGNPFLMLFLSALMEVPACVGVMFILDRTGRRSLCSSLMLIGGIACVVVSFLKKGEILTTVLAMIGKFAISGSFAVTFNFTAELFPTVVRNSAVGVGAMAARLGGALTPLIIFIDSPSMQLPTVIFGAVSIVAGVLTLMLPETANKKMPQTLEDL